MLYPLQCTQLPCLQADTELADVTLQVIDLVLAYEGDVMKFAGDSMIVAFYPKEEEMTADDLGLRSSTLRAAHCSSDLVQKYGEQQGFGCMLQP